MVVSIETISAGTLVPLRKEVSGFLPLIRKDVSVAFPVKETPMVLLATASVQTRSLVSIFQGSLQELVRSSVRMSELVKLSLSSELNVVQVIKS